MADIKLLALDLDGTLFNSQKVVSAENKKALRAARDKGIKVVITTGRPLKAISDLLEELDLISDEDYIITFNGGLVQKTNGDILDNIQRVVDVIHHDAVMTTDEVTVGIYCDDCKTWIWREDGNLNAPAP